MERIEAKLDKIEVKLDKVADNTARIDVTLGRQAVQLEEHIRRTNLLENRLTQNEKQSSKNSAAVLKHISIVQGIGYVVAGIVTALGAVATVMKILG